ncbi:Hypothetical_protein [Hexamita inflata]|uniref:Hypothetical_protein n=1 Tax=Hexamita inflata TaxID=28002 RepID=A0AA86RUF3_9EUKA|nr:Hypothetical protein HINF_LOCUS65857 [Hexamita inflata]CAI9978215.1 Hypothetical protein HINF_LOCUS65860 [Hexamita inflata]
MTLIKGETPLNTLNYQHQIGPLVATCINTRSKFSIYKLVQFTNILSQNNNLRIQLIFKNNYKNAYYKNTNKSIKTWLQLVFRYAQNTLCIEYSNKSIIQRNSSSYIFGIPMNYLVGSLTFYSNALNLEFK